MEVYGDLVIRLAPCANYRGRLVHGSGSISPEYGDLQTYMRIRVSMPNFRSAGKRYGRIIGPR